MPLSPLEINGIFKASWERPKKMMTRIRWKKRFWTQIRIFWVLRLSFPFFTAFLNFWHLRMVSTCLPTFILWSEALRNWIYLSMSLFADIQFWNNRKSLEGLSVRSVVFGVFQSLVVLLYVLDNDTNFVIRMSVFVGLVIEIWKINKVSKIHSTMHFPCEHNIRMNFTSTYYRNKTWNNWLYLGDGH